MSNILDDLFQWAGQQPAGYAITVNIAITSNEVTRSNLVSYAEGTLYYHPWQSAGMLFLPPWFGPFDTDPRNQLTQYFSDRKRNEAWGASPFDANNTDPLTVSIAWLGYRITLQSSKWGFTESFTPNFDAATNIIYGTVGGGLVTISLCNRRSVENSG